MRPSSSPYPWPAISISCARSWPNSFPTRIFLFSAGDLVVLSGEVSDVRVPERAAELAQLHAEKVANLIHVVGNQQVQLEVKFAEVSRTGLRQLGVNLFAQDAAGRFVTGMSAPGGAVDQFAAVPGTGTSGRPPVRCGQLRARSPSFSPGCRSFPSAPSSAHSSRAAWRRCWPSPRWWRSPVRKPSFWSAASSPSPLQRSRFRQRQLEALRHHPELHAHGDQRWRASSEAGERSERHRSGPLGHHRGDSPFLV